jgi:hypothetical protein
VLADCLQGCYGEGMSKGDIMNQPNIYALPHIAALRTAELNETDCNRKNDLHAAWLQAIKLEQIKRGQRTKMSYRGAGNVA